MTRLTERCGDLMERLGRSIFGWGMRLKTSQVTPTTTIPVPLMTPTQLRDHLNSMDIDSGERL